MADYLQYITEQGIVVPDTSSILTDIQNEWKGIFGSDLSVEPATPQGRVMEAQAMGRMFAIHLGAAVANQLNLDVATGQFLDAIGALFGIVRRSATNTEVQGILYGVAGTVIPSGSLVKTAEGKSFYLSGQVVISVDGYTIIVSSNQEEEKENISNCLSGNSATIAEDDTVKVGETVYTFKDSPSEATDIQVGATNADSIDNLFTKLGADSVSISAGDTMVVAGKTYAFAESYGSSGIFIASETGEVNCASNQLNTIVSNVVGWERVDNPSPAFKIGEAQESDSELRKRIDACRYKGTSLIGNMSSALYDIQGVKSSYVYNNGKETSQNLSELSSEQINVNGHSILLIAQGGDDEEIAKAMYDKISAGCGMTGLYHITVDANPTVGDEISIGNETYEFVSTTPSDHEIRIGADEEATASNIISAFASNKDVVATAKSPANNMVDIASLKKIVLHSSGLSMLSNVVVRPISDPYFNTSYDMIFNRPIPMPIYVKVWYENIAYTGADTTQSIKSAIIDWASGSVSNLKNLEVGSDISSSLLSYIITSQVEGIYITKLEVSSDGSTYSSGSISVNKDKIAEFAAQNIFVNP